MVGTEEQPGIVRRSISEIFRHREEEKAKVEICVKLYMVELYNDQLIDLLYKVCCFFYFDIL